MPDVVTPTPTPLPDFPAAPQVLGLIWHHSIMRQTRRGPRRLSKAWPTAAYDDLWSSRTGQAGLRMRGFDTDYEGRTVLHWGGEHPINPTDFDAIAREVAVEREAARIEAQRVRERLQSEVDAHWWAVPAERLQQAQALLRGSLLKADMRSQADMMADLIVEAVERAGRAVAKALAALPAEAIARCEDPTIQAAVHEACQIMSLADDDRAGLANSVGWSKSTCHRGHWLSELPELDAGLAAVGLRLVYGHRRQLRDDLRETLFPASRRAA